MIRAVPLSLLTALLIPLLFGSPARCAVADGEDPPRTGEFLLTSTIAEVAGADAADGVATVISSDEPVTWEIYVPDRYERENPPGLMVYISPSPSGEIPRGWKSVMDQGNVIWIAAARSGNRVSPARRALFALVAPTLAARHYAIDPERVYLTGLSGGGRMAGMVAADYPQLFKGAIFSCGVDFWDEHPPREFELFRRNHFVFVTGTRDHALEQTRRVHQRYVEAGVDNSELMIIRNMTHRNPDGPVLESAIRYLDSRIGSEDPATQPR